ncbi:MAG: hypothetical protein HRT35_33320 [Algicola sp.]|nr:hypothetical protein [Algicola sp.]
MRNILVKFTTIATLLLSANSAFAGSYTNTDLLDHSWGDRVHITVDGNNIKVTNVELVCGKFGSTSDGRTLKNGQTGTFKYSGHRGGCDTDGYSGKSVWVSATIKLKYSYKGLSVWRSCGEFEFQTIGYHPSYEYSNTFTVSVSGIRDCSNVNVDLYRFET